MIQSHQSSRFSWSLVWFLLQSGWQKTRPQEPGAPVATLVSTTVKPPSSRKRAPSELYCTPFDTVWKGGF